MKLRIDFKSITIQLLALLLVIAIVPALVLTVNTSNTMNAQKYEQFKEKAGDNGVIAGQAYKVQLNIINKAAISAAEDPRMFAALKADNNVAAKAVLNEYAGEYNLDIVSLIDENAVVLARSSNDQSGDTTANAIVLKTMSTGEEVTGTEIIPESTIKANNLQDKIKASGVAEGMGIVSCIPIKDESGKLLGSLYAASLQNGNNDLVDGIGTDAESACTLIQGDVRIATNLKDQSGSRITGTKISSAIADKVLKNGEIVEQPLVVNGKQMYVHYEPLKSFDGKNIGMLFVGYDMTDGLNELNSLLFMSVAIAAVLAIIALLAGFIIINRITRPINRLVAATDSIAAGKLDTVIDTGAKGGEIGKLTVSVTKMVGNIKERIAFNESILKGIAVPMMVTDMDRKITYVNEPFSKMAGVSKDNAVGRYCKDVLNAPICNTDQCMLKRTWREGDLRGAESKLTLQGKPIIFSCDATAIKDQNGKVTGGIEMLQDITEARNAQLKIQQAEKDTREKAAFSDGILKSIKDMHLVIDNSACITYMNESGQSVLGYTLNESAGKLITDITRFKTNGGRTIEALKTGQDIMGLEDEILLRNGTWLPVITYATIVRDASGKITGLSIIARDITRERDAKKQLQEITLSANKIAERVSGASGNVASSVQQVMSASRQISESIQQIASGSQTQAKSIENVSKLMHDMNNSINDVTAGARKTSEDAVRANAEARKGSENAKVAIRKMDELHVAVNDSAKIVSDLGDKSKQIGQIVDMITAIAGQTNLLALNAAIEAARAGDAGRGFAVVAEEVRKLAEEAAKAADQINSLIGEVREQTARAVESMNKGTREVDESNKIVAESLKSLEDISRLIDTTTAKAQEIAAMAEKQAADTQRVVKDVEEMAAVIEESAAGAEEVSASSEETTATAEQVAGMASELAKISDELKAEVGRLKAE